MIGVTWLGRETSPRITQGPRRDLRSVSPVDWSARTEVGRLSLTVGRVLFVLSFDEGPCEANWRRGRKVVRFHVLSAVTWTNSSRHTFVPPVQAGPDMQIMNGHPVPWSKGPPLRAYRRCLTMIVQTVKGAVKEPSLAFPAIQKSLVRPGAGVPNSSYIYISNIVKQWLSGCSVKTTTWPFKGCPMEVP